MYATLFLLLTGCSGPGDTGTTGSPKVYECSLEGATRIGCGEGDPMQVLICNRYGCQPTGWRFGAESEPGAIYVDCSGDYELRVWCEG
jgi:hypothetical protein